jgi:amino acid transporter
VAAHGASLRPSRSSSASATPRWRAIGSAKVAVVLLFIAVGLTAVKASNFFAFIGFDVIATAAEEVRRPQRDLPIGILGSLAICTALYVAVSLVMTGLLRYTELNDAAPMAKALKANGLDLAASLVSLGALAGLTTVILVLMMGQARVLFAMSRDRLLPEGLASVHPTFRTPWLISRRRPRARSASHGSRRLSRTAAPGSAGRPRRAGRVGRG